MHNECLKYLKNLKNDQNAPQTFKMTKIFQKSLKLLKYPQNLKMTKITLNLKNDQNTLESPKITKIPLKQKKNDQNTPETSKMTKIPQNLLKKIKKP